MTLNRADSIEGEPVRSRPAGQRSRHAFAAASAFTLVELILVMALIVIAVSMVTPRLAGFFRARAIDSEAGQLLSLTRAGQARAAAEGIPMRLWVDAQAGTYGLEAEAGFSDHDAKAEEFTVNEALHISIEETPDSAPAASATELTAKNSGQAHGQLPAIRFLPAGGIDEGSPRTLRLSDPGTGGVRSVTLSRNRLQYEIQDQ
jgi:type II secretory pathway pseudopilin PulG